MYLLQLKYLFIISIVTLTIKLNNNRFLIISGTIPGYRSRIRIYPPDKIGIIYAYNRHSIDLREQYRLIGRLEKLAREQIEELLSNELAIKTEDAVTVNLTILGYRKLLGTGRVTHPINVKVEAFSKLAGEKGSRGRGFKGSRGKTRTLEPLSVLYRLRKWQTE